MLDDPPLPPPNNTPRTGVTRDAGFTLSEAAASVWAKSNDFGGWLPLQTHLADTAAISGFLWDEWLPDHVKHTLAWDLDDDLAAARRRLRFLAGGHDLGKVTPAFAIQVPSLVEPMRDKGFNFRVKQFDPDRRLLPHSLASYFILLDWLMERHGWDRDTARSHAAIIGSHHGVTPTLADVSQPPQPHLFGGDGLWRSVQAEFVDYAVRLAGVEDDLVQWAKKPIPAQTQVLLTAVVIVADWLASDEKRFPYGEHKSSRERALKAWRELELMPSWRAILPGEDADEIIRSRFLLKAEATARPVQRTAIEVARAMTEPGLMIIEAPMGIGKTEAALVCAEILAARFGLGGCFVALPTMATSDAMFARVENWIRELPHDPSAPFSKQSLFLAHSKASLNDNFLNLVKVRELGGVGDDQVARGESEETLVAHSWLTGKKKGPLANFVVGTVDQILFAGLKSRHLMLRHLAIVNKVVIVDEVHSYDSYMNVYLDRVLGWLGEYGVPVIMLSATLPSSRRIALVEAYEHGAESRIKRGSTPTTMAELAAMKLREQEELRVEVRPERYPILRGEIGYPVITATTPTDPTVTPVSESSPPQRVHFEMLADDDAALIATLDVALRDGGCAAVIRNTVGRAQETMRLLEEHFGAEVELTLAHSRFVASDRMESDARLRSDFGPPGGMTQRPSKAIVVGTQVLEQSLDIDFDVMITDLAPMDLLLQRVGRLYRHDRGPRPAGVASPRCFVTGVEDWASSPPTVAKVAELIYGSYLLLRTLAVLRTVFARDGIVTLPGDIPTLVELSYEGSGSVPDDWHEEVELARQHWETEITDKKMSARGYLLGPVASAGGSIVDWIARGVGEADDSVQGQAQVRDTEDSVEVLVVRRVDGALRTLPGLKEGGDRIVPEEGKPEDSVARIVANSSIRLPYSLCTPWRIDGVVGALEQNAFAGWQQSPWLKGQLVLVLDSEMNATLHGATVHYDKKIGLTVVYEKKDGFHE
jgi:CRISPR-associated endonuclease/helicase Cas3